MNNEKPVIINHLNNLELFLVFWYDLWLVVDTDSGNSALFKVKELPELVFSYFDSDAHILTYLNYISVHGVEYNLKIENSKKRFAIEQFALIYCIKVEKTPELIRILLSSDDRTILTRYHDHLVEINDVTGLRKIEKRLLNLS